MDILAYEYTFQNLKDYNDSLEQNYGNTVVTTPPTNPTFPLTIFEEIRNTANTAYKTAFDRVASVGYRLDIYAKTKGNLSKRIIARGIAEMLDNFLSRIGLTRISFNVSELENDSSIYHIIITYSGNLHENRRKFI